MSQVEGGDLLVIQKGHESSPRRSSTTGLTSSGTTAGWNDGPWWRSDTPRSISAVNGAVEGSKLVRASAEGYATEYFASRGGVEEAAKQASEVLNESNPTRNSDIFLAIQAVSQNSPKDFFTASSSNTPEKQESAVEAPNSDDEEIAFAIYLHDPIHGIAFHAISQPIPQKWIDWLDAPSSPNDDGTSNLPESIAEIIESGGVDPREWVSEWVEETLSLGVGVVAQRYVARRMGVGEGGVGRGKMRAEKQETVESGAGEAARAI
jgi:hypothetical protein